MFLINLDNERRKLSKETGELNYKYLCLFCVFTVFKDAFRSIIDAFWNAVILTARLRKQSNNFSCHSTFINADFF